MRKALRDWWQSKGRSGGELCPAGERHDRAFECLPSDQPLIQSDLLRGVPLSGLKGLADSADWQRSFDPAGRGAGEWRSFHGRALLDREFVRVSKQNICRLMDRWPAMVRSAGRFSCVPRSVDDESRSAEQNALLDVIIRRSSIRRNLFGLCCDNREGDRRTRSLCKDQSLLCAGNR